MFLDCLLQDDLRLLEDIDEIEDAEDLDLAANDFDAEPIKKDEVVTNMLNCYCLCYCCYTRIQFTSATVAFVMLTVGQMGLILNNDFDLI